MTKVVSKWVAGRQEALIRGMSGLSNKKDESKKQHIGNEFLKVHPESATQRGAHVTKSTCGGGIWI
jgi:hypothetical protein